jgi:putative flippase GtrA
MWRPNRRVIKLFLNYVWIGGFATVVDTAALLFFRVKLELYVWLSAALAYLCGMGTNFLLNKYLNFASDSRSFLKQARTFFIVALTGLALKAGLMELFVQAIHMRLLVAQVCAVGLVMIWSFWGHHKMTFRGGIRWYMSERLRRRIGENNVPETDPEDSERPNEPS